MGLVPRPVAPAHVILSSYGNDSVALIQWASEQKLPAVTVLYNDTGWARDDWGARVLKMEGWVADKGFASARTQSIGLEALVRQRKAWPRQGMQFCTLELKIAPTLAWLTENDPTQEAVCVIGVRREESVRRRAFPEWNDASPNHGDRAVWAPMVDFSEDTINSLLERAGVLPLPHRSMECFPCINSNRRDLLELAANPARIDEINSIEVSLGTTSKGKPRTMFRPYHYMGATGIREIVRWAKSPHGKFDLNDGGGPGCEAGFCGT